jgi:hypothetical protein
MKRMPYARTMALLTVLFLSAVCARLALAEDYSGANDVHSGFAAAGLLDPSDPLGAIQCRHNCGHCENCSDCGRDCHSDRGAHRDRNRQMRIVNVDCSRQRSRERGWEWSVGDALRRVAPNGTVNVLAPGEGATCVESLVIHTPVTIATLGAGTRAVIQAPEGRPCIVADIALGDALSLQNLKIIARGHDAACVQVTAGTVDIRNSDIDSRSTNWAFDVGASGELRITGTRVETDGAGVRAERAYVSISGLGIDMAPNRSDAALQFERTDGHVDKVQIIGGYWGVLASPGAHGLSLSNIEVSKAAIGAEFVAGAQGAIRANSLWLWRNRRGLVVGPGVDADISQSAILRSEQVSAVLLGAAARLQSNRMMGGRIGVRLQPADAFSWADVPFKPVNIFTDNPAPALRGNQIGAVAEAGIAIDRGAYARAFQNTIATARDGECIVGEGAREMRRSNQCLEASRGDDGDWDGARPSFGWRSWFHLDADDGVSAVRSQSAAISFDAR